jgi:hypothetical protein
MTRISVPALLVVICAMVAGCGVRPTVSPPVSTPTVTNRTPTPVGLRDCAPHPGRCGYPDETSTGVPAGTALRPSQSVNADTPGMVIENLDITGEINVSAPNVTIRRVRVTGGRPVGNADWAIVVRATAENLVIEDSEIGTPAGSAQDMACILNIGDSRPTMRRLNIHGCSAGISTGGGLVEDSYIHDMSAVAGLSHVVGVASNGGGGLTVSHNTILNTFDQTAAIAFYQDFSEQSDNLVTDNLVGGGGYCFYGGAGPKGATRSIRFVGNRLTRSIFPSCGSYGVMASFTTTDPGNEFRGNIWDDTGMEVVL